MFYVYFLRGVRNANLIPAILVIFIQQKPKQNIMFRTACFLSLLVLLDPVSAFCDQAETARRIERLDNKIDKIGDDMKTVVKLVVEMQQVRDDINAAKKDINKNSEDLRLLTQSFDSLKKKISFLFDGLYGIWTILLALTSGGVITLLFSNFSGRKKSEKKD